MPDHVAPRTQLYFPKGDFPVPLHHTDRHRQTKTSNDVLHEATYEDSWNFDGDKTLYETLDECDQIRIDQQRPTRRTHVGSRQIDFPKKSRSEMP